MTKTVAFQMADICDPRVLTMNGLRREGDRVVVDDDDAVLVYTYTKAEMRRIERR